MDGEVFLLIVQEDKRHMEQQADPTPQLVAGAIAFFFANNKLDGTAPVGIAGGTRNHRDGNDTGFFQIPVTLESVESGLFPSHATVVHMLLPPVPRIANLDQECMVPLNNRRVILQCYEAFKQFLATVTNTEHRNAALSVRLLVQSFSPTRILSDKAQYLGCVG